MIDFGDEDGEGGGFGFVTSCCVPAQLFQTAALRDFSPGLQCSAQD